MDRAFDILAEQYRPMLFSYASALAEGDLQTAEDVVQETFLAAFKQLDRFRRGEDFGKWLRGIARHKSLECRRAAGRGRMIVDSRILDGMEEVFAVFDRCFAGEEPWRERLKRLLRHCIEQLSQHLGSAVARFYLEGMTLREAATAENASSTAVAQRLSRARALIRTCVQDQLDRES